MYGKGHGMAASVEQGYRMKYHCEYASCLAAKGGPDPEDYAELDAWVAEIGDNLRHGRFSRDEMARLIEAFGEAFSVETMQGFAFRKPHGYAGDFEIIDRIYQRYSSSRPHLTRWDQYWQSHPAAQAVRNRVGYFIDQIQSRVGRASHKSIHVLNLASGPGRDMLHFFRGNPASEVVFDCVEQDRNAVEYAISICRDYLANVRFHNRNALRFQSKTKYDLIWSAGLFDYFEEEVFVFMLRKLKPMVGIRRRDRDREFFTDESQQALYGDIRLGFAP